PTRDGRECRVCVRRASARRAPARGSVAVAKHIVARVDEIPPGGRKIVRVEGREVGIFNLDGEFYALKNSCPHQAARVCLGRIVGTSLPSDVYEYRYGEEGRILRCPWHAWEYDIRTG